MIAFGPRGGSDKQTRVPAIGTAALAGAVQLAENVSSLRLVLSDIQLDAGTGPELIRHICRARPELKAVFMTADANVNFRRTDRVVLKPFKL